MSDSLTISEQASRSYCKLFVHPNISRQQTEFHAFIYTQKLGFHRHSKDGLLRVSNCPWLELWLAPWCLHGRAAVQGRKWRFVGPPGILGPQGIFTESSQPPNGAPDGRDD